MRLRLLKPAGYNADAYLRRLRRLPRGQNLRIVRYLSREVFHCMLVLMLIFLFIMVSNTFVRYISAAASGTMSSSAVLNLISFTVPNFIVVLIPITFFLALVITLGRLFADSELLVLLACGLSWADLIKMGLKLAFFLALCVAFLSFWLVPKMLSYRDNLQAASQGSSQVSDLQTGRFILFNNSQQVIYVGEANKTNTQFRKLFMFEQEPHGVQKVTLAPEASQSFDKDLNNQALILNHGAQYKFSMTSPNIQENNFYSYKLPINYSSRASQNSRLSALSTWALMQDGSIQAVNEMIWRTSQVVTVFVLLFLGLAICYVPPRKSRYIKIIPAVLIFMIYFNLLAISKSWGSSHWILLIINVWWVHLLFLSLSLSVLFLRDGKSWFIKNKKIKN